MGAVVRPMFVRHAPKGMPWPAEPAYRWATGCRVCGYVDFSRNFRIAMLRADVHADNERCAWAESGEPAHAH